MSRYRRAVEEVAHLRNYDACHAVRKAVVATFRDNFRIVHISIQGTHISMRRSRSGSACGSVFTDRYHVTIIRTTKHARHELAYVLNNWRRHESQKRLSTGWRIDPFSSAPSFDGAIALRARRSGQRRMCRCPCGNRGRGYCAKVGGATG